VRFPLPFLLLFLALVPAPRALAGEVGRPRALMVIDQSPDGAPDAVNAARAATRVLSRSYSFIAPAADGRIWPDLRPEPLCEPAALAARAADVDGLIAEGRSLFFEQMDPEGAAAKLASAVDSFFAGSCMAGNDSVRRREVCRAAVLLARIHLLAGRPESASSTAMSIAGRCTREETSGEDVPPDVRAFMDRALSGAGVSRGDGRPGLGVACRGTCRNVLVDGRPPECADAACVRGTVPAVAGRHVVESFDGRSWFSAGFDYAGDGAVLLVSPGTRPLGDLAVVSTDAAFPDAAILSAIPGVNVVRIAVSADGPGWTVTGSGPDMPSCASLATVVPQDGSFRFSVSPDSPLVIGERRPWPWPWVSGSVSTAFLAAGIVLNVFAEQALDDASDGRNTMSDYELLKDLAIAGYAIAGAGAVATILLAVLRPGPDRSVLVVPSPAGFTLKF